MLTSEMFLSVLPILPELVPQLMALCWETMELLGDGRGWRKWVTRKRFGRFDMLW